MVDGCVVVWRCAWSSCFTRKSGYFYRLIADMQGLGSLDSFSFSFGQALLLQQVLRPKEGTIISMRNVFNPLQIFV